MPSTVAEILEMPCGWQIPILARNWRLGNLAPEHVTAEGLFQVDAIERLRPEHVAGRANHSHILWRLIVSQDWRGRWQV